MKLFLSTLLCGYRTSSLAQAHIARVERLGLILLSMSVTEPENIAVRGHYLLQATPGTRWVGLHKEAMQGAQCSAGGLLVAVEAWMCGGTFEGIQGGKHGK